MRRVSLRGFLLASLLIVPHSASADVSTMGPIALTSTMAMAFKHGPLLTRVPGGTVCVAKSDPGCDLFRYSDRWYAFCGGVWYRARTHRGPFRAVSVRVVPAAVVNVPARFWHQAPPNDPAQMRGRGGAMAQNDASERTR